MAAEFHHEADFKTPDSVRFPEDWKEGKDSEITPPAAQRNDASTFEGGATRTPPCESPAATPAPRVKGKREQADNFKTRIEVYHAIVAHQKGADWWRNHDDLTMLGEWAPELIKELPIRLKDATYAAVPLIRIESMNVRTIGTYRAAADGYAIGGTIVLNEERLSDLPDYMKLALLVKLLFCARQHQKGGNGTLDSEGRDEMKAAGLEITEEGAITVTVGRRFHELLDAHGIDVSFESTFPKPSRKGKTTNQLWSCACQKARVGTKEFCAVCTKCHQPFRLGDFVGT